MSQLIQVTDVDREFYETRIRRFVPDEIIDIHTHIWLSAPPETGVAGRDATGRLATWPSRVAAASPVDELLETYGLMLPGKRVTPLVFNSPVVEGTFDDLNGYVSDSAARHELPWLMLCPPGWSAEKVDAELDKWQCAGVKVYLGYAPAHIAAEDITIFDFLPEHQLEVLNRRGSIVMLHLPRPGRLRDPANLEQMLEIEQRFPQVKLVIAHVGRAYCEQDIGNAFEVLKDTERMSFDISANTNTVAFRLLLECVGPRRVLFGSDLPIARMRMRRVCGNGRYINIVPRGLYGDVSADPHMREAEGVEADRLSFFLYEEIDAFRRAAAALGLTAADVKDVFCGNAKRMIPHQTIPQLQDEN